MVERAAIKESETGVRGLDYRWLEVDAVVEEREEVSQTPVCLPRRYDSFASSVDRVLGKGNNSVTAAEFDGRFPGRVVKRLTVHGLLIQRLPLSSSAMRQAAYPPPFFLRYLSSLPKCRRGSRPGGMTEELSSRVWAGSRSRLLLSATIWGTVRNPSPMGVSSRGNPAADATKGWSGKRASTREFAVGSLPPRARRSKPPAANRETSFPSRPHFGTPAGLARLAGGCSG